MHVFAPYATAASIIAALFLGFLQLPGFWLLPLGVLAVVGSKFYHPTELNNWFAYLKQFLVSLVCLSLVEWIARLASLYMTG